MLDGGFLGNQFWLKMNLGQIGVDFGQLIFGRSNFIANLPKLLPNLSKFFGGSQWKRRRHVERRQFLIGLPQSLPEWQCLTEPLNMRLAAEALFALFAKAVGRFNALVSPLAKFLVVTGFDHRMAKLRGSVVNVRQKLVDYRSLCPARSHEERLVLLLDCCQAPLKIGKPAKTAAVERLFQSGVLEARLTGGKLGQRKTEDVLVHFGVGVAQEPNQAALIKCCDRFLPPRRSQCSSGPCAGGSECAMPSFISANAVAAISPSCSANA